MFSQSSGFEITQAVRELVVEQTYPRRVQEIEAAISKPVKRSESTKTQARISKGYFAKRSPIQIAVSDWRLWIGRITGCEFFLKTGAYYQVGGMGKSGWIPRMIVVVMTERDISHSMHYILLSGRFISTSK